MFRHDLPVRHVVLKPFRLVADGVGNGFQNGLLSLFQVGNVRSDAILTLLNLVHLNVCERMIEVWFSIELIGKLQ